MADKIDRVSSEATTSTQWTPEVVQQLNARFADHPPAEILQWGLATFLSDIVLATSFGPQSIVLMHLISQIFYSHLVLLHLSLLLRVGGDLAIWLPARQWGGLLNVIALLLFLANTGRAILRPAGK